MESFCEQFSPCYSLLPQQWHWLFAAIVPIAAVTLIAVPVAKILHRAGRSRWWTILAFVPLLNLISLWIFAFTPWPAVQGK